MKKMKKILPVLTALLMLTLLVSCKQGDSPVDGTTSTGATEHTHNYITEVVPPNCVREGYTLHTCLDCDHYYTDTPTAPAPHTYVDTVVRATCAVEGYTTHTCSVCGHSYTDSHIPKYDHIYGEEVVDPSCTEGGYTVHTCYVCKDSYTDTPTQPTGHHYYPEVTAPTGTEQGYTDHICYNCGDTYRDTYTDPVQRLIMATFDANGGVMPEHPRTIYLYNTGEQATLPVPTREGYVFDGWYLEVDDEEGDDIHFTDGIWSAPEDVWLVAHWSRITAPVTLTLGEGGADIPWSNPIAAWGLPISGLPTPEAQFGYLFDGWYDGETRITDTLDCYYTSPVTLTARFLAPQETGTLTAKNGTPIPWAIDAAGLLSFHYEGTEQIKLAIPEGAFEKYTSILSVSFPRKLTVSDIGRRAFAGCANLRSFAVPGTAGVIRSSVFEGCTALTELTLGSGISVINQEAFKGCSSLTTLTLPLSLYQIYSPFEGCAALSTIRYEGTEFQWSVIVKDAAALDFLTSPTLQFTYEVPLD